MNIILENAAKIQDMDDIQPGTLEKLAKLQSQYPGAVDIFKLKDCQNPGEADHAVEKYIELVYSKLKLRSYLVQLVKDILKKSNTESVKFSELQIFYASADAPPPFLNREELHGVLMELCSPLTGYLGCHEGEDIDSDRFYYLRDLEVV